MAMLLKLLPALMALMLSITLLAQAGGGASLFA
jgi:hypothetical protein